MTEPSDTKTKDEAPEFPGELTDEALDRPRGEPTSSLCPVFPSAPAR
jgi:hypothetical protein